MGANSKIEWTTHTFNPWRGCSKVSAGCEHCYAEALSKRNPAVMGEWGDDGTRIVASESMWREPIKWNKAAACIGSFDCVTGHSDACPQLHRPRVFCASLADVFEDRPELVVSRVRLLRLISATPNLDWLLLTKRPENIAALLPDFPWVRDWLRGYPPENVWLGASVENQATANERIPHLLRIPAAVRFLSVEPLLGPVVLRLCFGPQTEIHRYGIQWVIVGGESGPHARPMHPQWVRSIRDQCQASGVPFFFKQWGEWAPLEKHVVMVPTGNYAFIPGGEKVVPEHDQREQHIWQRTDVDDDCFSAVRVGKKAAGRTLDGRTWDEFPSPPLPLSPSPCLPPTPPHA